MVVVVVGAVVVVGTVVDVVVGAAVVAVVVLNTVVVLVLGAAVVSVAVVAVAMASHVPHSAGHSLDTGAKVPVALCSVTGGHSTMPFSAMRI